MDDHVPIQITDLYLYLKIRSFPMQTTLGLNREIVPFRIESQLPCVPHKLENVRFFPYHHHSCICFYFLYRSVNDRHSYAYAHNSVFLSPSIPTGYLFCSCNFSSLVSSVSYWLQYYAYYVDISYLDNTLPCGMFVSMYSWMLIYRS